MPEAGERRILHPSGSRRERDDLVRSLFALALASRRTRRFCIYSPWITDLVILDNGQGQLRGLIADDTLRRVRLVQYLAALHDRGVDLRVITRRDRRDRQLADFAERFADEVHPDNLRFCDELHAKGIVTELFAITGSMNLTHSGVHLHREGVVATTVPAEVAAAAHDFLHQWDQLGGQP